MESRDFIVVANRQVANRTFRMELRSVEPGFMFEGEFVDIRLEGYYLRRPISVCDYTENGITLLYRVVGDGTRHMSSLPEGTRLNLLTGLGHGFSADACTTSALLVGGGMGVAPLLPLARELVRRGRKVISLLGFNSMDDMALHDEFCSLSDSVIVYTMDGSFGTKGLVTSALPSLKGEYDFFYTCGPMPMMKAVCAAVDTDGEVSLEERMGCGVGICYGCTCSTLVGPRRICKDGPVFRKEEIVW